MARRGKGKGKGKGGGVGDGAVLDVSTENSIPKPGKALKKVKSAGAGSDDGGPGYDAVMALKKEVRAKKKEISTLKRKLTKSKNALDAAATARDAALSEVAALKAQAEEIPALQQDAAKASALAKQLTSFECPITHEVPEDPADCFFSLVDGRVYSLAAVKPWLQEKGTSPVTRQPMTLADLVPFNKGDTKAGRLLRSGLGDKTHVSWVEGGTLHFMTRELGQRSRSGSKRLRVQSFEIECGIKKDGDWGAHVTVVGRVCPTGNGPSDLSALRYTLRVHTPEGVKVLPPKAMSPSMCIGLNAVVSLRDGTAFFGTMRGYDKDSKTLFIKHPATKKIWKFSPVTFSGIDVLEVATSKVTHVRFLPGDNKEEGVSKEWRSVCLLSEATHSNGIIYISMELTGIVGGEDDGMVEEEEEEEEQDEEEDEEEDEEDEEEDDY